MNRRLTNRQRQVFEFLKDYIKENGYAPTLRDICGFLSIKGPNNARKHLENLAKKGFIKRSAFKSRAIEILESPVIDSNNHDTPQDWFLTRAVSVPIVGRVRAGSPELAVEDINGYVTLDSGFFKCKGAFLLQVEGESMIDAGIDNGDYLLVRPQQNARSGDIVVAMIEDEATVKRFIRKGTTITLKPENQTMQPISVDPARDFAVVGKVVDVIKRLES